MHIATSTSAAAESPGQAVLRVDAVRRWCRWLPPFKRDHQKKRFQIARFADAA
jgi:hypothetical protein